MRIRAIAQIAAILLILFCSANGQSGWSAIATMQPFPSPYISDWEANPNLGNLSISNNSGQEQNIKIFLSLTRNNNQLIGTASSQPILIQPSPPATILDNTRMVDYETFEYDESIETDIIRTGRLPEGEYEVCIRIEDLTSNTLTDHVCAEFYIVYPDPPSLVYPLDGDNVQIDYPLFQWIPLQVPPDYQIHYIMRIAEVLPGQTELQALEANIPQFEDFNILSPSLQYPINALPLIRGTSYVWQVQALDQYGFPPSANQGKSEIWEFVFGDTTPEPPNPNFRNISGYVRDLYTESPIEQARVVYHGVNAQIGPDGIEYIDLPESLVTTTNAEGFFQFRELRDSTYFKICARAHGYVPSCQYGLDQNYIGNITYFPLELTEDFGDLNGRIIDRITSQPIPEIVVQLWQSCTTYVAKDSSGNNPDPEYVRRQITSSRSDISGNFAFEHIDGGDDYFVVINDPQYDSIISDDFAVTGGTTRDLGDYRLMPKFGGITGSVKIAGTDTTISMAEVFIYADSGFTFPDKLGGYGQPPIGVQPLFGPDTTNEVGAFSFENVRLNDFQQVTNRYAIYIRAPGYRDALLPARITSTNRTANLEVELNHELGTIYGTVTSLVGSTPIGDAEVILYPQFGSGHSADQPLGRGAIRTFTNPDGSYIIGNIPSGTYENVTISKSGYEEFVASGPIEIANGQVMRLDAALNRPTGIVQGTVSDDDGQSLFGVIITSPDAPYISEVSSADGSFLINNVPSGTILLEFHSPGYADAVETLSVVAQETTTVTVTMAGYRGSITVFVRDSTTGGPLVNAVVKMQGEQDQTTDVSGSVTYNRLIIGAKTLRIIPPISDSVDYCEKSTNIEIVNGPNLSVTVTLLRGGRISGTVELVGEGAISGASVEIEGNNNISDTTDATGHFALRNVPAGNSIELSASKIGYRTGRLSGLALSPGQHLQSLVIRVEESPIDSVFGFAIEVDSIIEMGGGNKKVIGAIVRVPTTPVLRLADPSFRFYFNDLRVDSRYQPTASSFDLNITEVPVKVFGKLDAILTDTSGGFVKVQRVDSLAIGEIRGDLIMDNAIPRWIPGAAWATEKIQKNMAPAFWADGVFHGVEGQNYGLSVSGSSVSARFWGFGISVDYARTTMDSAGFHYYGSLQFPRLSREIGIEDLNIRKNESSGRLEFVGVGVKTTPPIEITIGSFKVVDSSAAWNESGFRADGAIVVQSLGRQFGFRNLRISPEGDFLSLAITADSASGTINVLSSQFRIQSIEFGTEDSTHIRYFQFSGALNIPQLGQPIEFQNLKYTERNEFSGTIQFNQSKTFAQVLTVQLHSIEFNSDSRGKFIFVSGGVAFNIPNLHVQVGNFRFYDDGGYSVEQISVSFNAGPVLVAIEANWSDNIFQGSGTLIVRPAFTAACQFRYGGTSDWWIKVTAGLNIPIGTFTIVEASGEIGYREGTWTFGLGGGITVGQLEKALRLNMYVKVVSTPGGPIINGTANVVAFSGMQIGEATINLDFANNRFTGNILMGFNKSGVEISAQIDVDIKSGQYWYVGGSANVNFFRMAQLNSRLCAANNYTGWMHSFPVTYHPDNQTINGFHADLSYHVGTSGPRWSMSIDTWAYIMINWNGDLAAGAKFAFDSYIDLWIIGGSAQVNLEAAIQNTNNCLSLYGNANAQLKLWVGCCNRNKGCWSVCWAWIFPCGFTACFNVSFTANYNCNSGWVYNVNW